MDIAALIVAPLILALIYSWPGINRLPFLVRVGLPVALMAALFIAFIGYGPALQEAVTTKTPLIRTFGLRNFALHLDGLSLLFALLMTGIGTAIALYAGAFFAEGDVHRRFVRTLMALVGAMLGFVLTDYAKTLPLFWVFTAVFLSSLINFGRQNEMRPSSKLGRLWEWVSIGRVFILWFAMGVLEEGGAIAKRMTQSLVEISQLSAANLSNSIIYEVFLGVIIFWLLLAALFTMVQWRSAKNMPVVAHAFVSAAMMSGMLYLLARLYPAIHDNPLWWTIVTGIGLLIMLLGALWALRQSDPKAILIYRSMSAFGACIALLGLPEFLGYKVALIGIVVHTLSHAALFLNLDNTYKQSRLIIVALATLPLAIFYVLMIEAFYRVTLAWSGIALAVVVVSIALWVISAIRIIREALSQPDSVGAQRAAPSLWIIPGLLAFASILCILLFDPLFAPLLNPMITRPPFESYLATSIGLGILAAVGGAILYTTRETWSRFIPTSPVPQIDNLPEH